MPIDEYGYGGASRDNSAHQNPDIPQEERSQEDSDSGATSMLGLPAPTSSISTAARSAKERASVLSWRFRREPRSAAIAKSRPTHSSAGA